MKIGGIKKGFTNSIVSVILLVDEQIRPWEIT
jgi:hypothetical protein